MFEKFALPENMTRLIVMFIILVFLAMGASLYFKSLATEDSVTTLVSEVTTQNQPQTHTPTPEELRVQMEAVAPASGEVLPGTPTTTLELTPPPTAEELQKELEARGVSSFVPPPLPNDPSSIVPLTPEQMQQIRDNAPKTE